MGKDLLNREPLGVFENEPLPPVKPLEPVHKDELVFNDVFNERRYYKPIVRHTLLPDPGWVWENHLKLGEVNALGGPEGVGKTCFILYLAAIVSGGGSWPDGTLSPKGRVLMFARERVNEEKIELFDKFGGVRSLLEVRYKDRRFNLRKNPWEFCYEVKIHEPKLVLIDTLQDFDGLGDRLKWDSHAAKDIVSGLLGTLAADLGCAIVYTRHMNKNDRRERKLSGTRGFTQATGYCFHLQFERPEPIDPEHLPRVLRLLRPLRSGYTPPELTWLTKHSGYEWRTVRPPAIELEDKSIVILREIVRDLAEKGRGRVRSELVKRALPEGFEWTGRRGARELLKHLGKPLGIEQDRDEVSGRHREGSVWTFKWPPEPGTFLSR